MNRPQVMIGRYEKPLESVRKVVDACDGFKHLPANGKVFIKPNIVFWTKATSFPKWGVITTSRVIEDIIILLKERGIDDITIGEGIVADPTDKETPAHAFETLGYNVLKEKYGIKCYNVMDRPFKKVDLGDGIVLKFNQDALESDFIVDLPVMKAHNQTVVSLGIKNIKGIIDIPSRKMCHNADPQKDLNYFIARLADKLPPLFTLIDGIYSLEKGPAFDGRMHRSNLLIGSNDFLAADLVGAKVLGHDPAHVPHLMHAATNHQRPLDLSDIDLLGEKIEDVAKYHDYIFPYVQDENGEMPTALAKSGIKGLFYRKYDLSMCTYCSGLNGVILSAIRYAWEGKAWDNVEVLTGKRMQPTPGMKKTVLLGKCMYQANKDHPHIQEMIAVKGCPPKPTQVVKALHQAGIQVDPALFEQIDQLPGFFMARYQNQPEFDESFFQVA